MSAIFGYVNKEGNSQMTKAGNCVTNIIKHYIQLEENEKKISRLTFSAKVYSKSFDLRGIRNRTEFPGSKIFS